MGYRFQKGQNAKGWLSGLMQDPKKKERAKANLLFKQPSASEMMNAKPGYTSLKGALRTQLYAEGDGTPHQANDREFKEAYGGEEDLIIQEYIRPTQAYRHTKLFNPQTAGQPVRNISAVVQRIRLLIAPGGKNGTIYVPASTNARMKRIAQASELKLALSQVLNIGGETLTKLPLYQGLQEFSDAIRKFPEGYRGRIRTNASDKLRDLKKQERALKGVVTKFYGDGLSEDEFSKRLNELRKGLQEDPNANPWIYEVDKKWRPGQQSAKPKMANTRGTDKVRFGERRGKTLRAYQAYRPMTADERRAAKERSAQSIQLKRLEPWRTEERMEALAAQRANRRRGAGPSKGKEGVYGKPQSAGPSSAGPSSMYD